MPEKRSWRDSYTAPPGPKRPSLSNSPATTSSSRKASAARKAFYSTSSKMSGRLFPSTLLGTSPSTPSSGEDIRTCVAFEVVDAMDEDSKTSLAPSPSELHIYPPFAHVLQSRQSTDIEYAPQNNEQIQLQLQLNGFSSLPSPDRHEFYQAAFSNREIPLRDLAQVDLSDDSATSSDHPTEMTEAWLTYATVTAQIWSNYDSCTRRFFQQPSRLQDCGKIYLSPTHRKRLEIIPPHKLEMRNVRLDIGTPFRTLFQVFLTVLPDGNRASLRVQYQELPDPNGRHFLLIRGVEISCLDLRNSRLAYGAEGLTIQDLDEIARFFAFLPKDEIEAGQWYYG